MKNRYFALFIVFTFILNAVSFTFAAPKSSVTQNQLLALLPASDIVVSVDSKRLFTSALPQILSGNKEALDEVNGKIDEFKANTSIDIRQFEQLAVGLASKQTAEGKTAFDPVVLARGTFGANSLVTLAKFASSGKHREEKIGGKNVYIFSPKEIIEKNRTAVKSSFIQKLLDNILPKLSGELAVTAYDENTLAFGAPERVRLMLTDSKSRVDKNLLALVNRNANAVASFAANLPNGLSGFMELAGDELGQNLGAIRQINGMMDVVGENTSISVTAKTLKVEQAESLKQSFEGLQGFFSGILLANKGDDKKAYGRMLKSAKFLRTGSQLTIDLQILQSDINVLIGAK